MSDTHKTESLHDQIMRLPRDPAEYTNVNMMLAYKDGHRDARHAAAELAAAYEADAQQAAPAGWKLVPVEPTNAMWTAVNKLDDEMVAGGYDGKGCSIEQAWSCMLAAAPTPPAGPWESPCTTPAQQPVAVKSHGAWDGLELLAEQPDGTELYAAQPAQQIDQLRHERDALAEAIGKAAARVGLVAPDTPLTGPMLLMLCDDIAECCLSAESAATPAQQSQWVPSRKQLPPLDIPVWLSDEGRGVFIGMRSSSTDGWLWAECDAYRFFGGQWESIEAHFDDFEPSCWMPLPAAPGDTAAPEQPSLGCDYHGSHFGASYPDAQCTDGYLWDEDSCDEPGGPLRAGGDIPCPKCNAAEYAQYLRDVADGEERAPEQADSQDELREEIGGLKSVNTTLVQVLKRLTFHARTTGGTAGPDAGLMEACEQAEHALSLGGFGRAYMEGADAALELAEQPHPVNRSVIRDVFLRNGFTIKEGHSDLKPYVYAAAEELLALDGKEVAAEQDAVTVPRGLLECYLNGGGDWVEAGHKLRDLLGGGA